MPQVCPTVFYKSFRHFFCIMMLSQQNRPLTPTLGQYWPHVSRSVCLTAHAISFNDYWNLIDFGNPSPKYVCFSNSHCLLLSVFILDVWN